MDNRLTALWRKHRELIEFVGLVIAWPIGAYLLIQNFVAQDYYGPDHAGIAVGLAVSGMIAWVWRHH